MQLFPHGSDRPNVQAVELDKPVTLQQSAQDCQTLEAFEGAVEAWGWRWTDGMGEINITHAPYVLGRSLSVADLQVAVPPACRSSAPGLLWWCVYLRPRK